MPTAAAAVVVSWVGGSAAVGAVVGAVTYGAVAGAIAGAVIGAASAIVTGGNLFEGALKGAAIGGVVGGISGGVLGAGGYGGAFNTTTVPATVSTPTAEATTGLDVAPSASIPEASLAGPGTKVAGGLKGATPGGGLPPTGGGGGGVSGMSDAKAKIYAGAGEGLFKSAGQVGASMMEAKSNEEMLAQKRIDDQAKIAANTPGQFKAQTANIDLPDDWPVKYINAKANIEAYKPPAGLLA